MRKEQIIEELPKLSPEDRAEIQAYLNAARRDREWRKRL
jgi:hypothetical protein